MKCARGKKEMTTQAKPRPYRPSNGIEGEIFENNWCYKCGRYREDPESSDHCSIHIAAMCFDIGEPDYPPEWCYDDFGRPQCTGFESIEEKERREAQEARKAAEAAAIASGQLALFEE